MANRYSSAARTARHGARAYTLIEVLIVVVILGVLASVVIAQVRDATDDAARAAFITDMRILAEAAQRYKLHTGEKLPEAPPGVVPLGWEPYIDQGKWAKETPIGGAWVSGAIAPFNGQSTLGIDFFNGSGPDRDDAYMAQIDAVIDDGDVTTGVFRRVGAQRYFLIVQ